MSFWFSENYISKDVLDKLNLKKIDDDKVVLVPKLLGDKNINNIKKYLDKKEIEEANITLWKMMNLLLK